MRRVAAVLSAAAVAAMVVGLSAQNAKLNGHWTRDMDKSPMAQGGGGGGRAGGGAAGGGGGAARGGGGGMGAGAFTIAVTATSLTRTPDAGAGGNAPTATVYTLDGAKHDMPAGRGGTATYVAKWDDSKANVEISTTRDNNGTAMTSKQVYSVEGDWLLITSTSGDQPATKVYYKKA